MRATALVMLLVLAFAISGVPSVYAQAPWTRIALFNRIEADPNKSYQLGEENGPWLIMATTFRGPEAAKQAHELVLELRKEYKLSAYTHQQVYDYTGEVEGRGLNPDGTPKTMKYAQDDRVQEIAVLVGDYDSVDDPKAQKTLKLLKYTQPASLAVDKGKGTSQSFAALRRFQQKLMGNDDEDKKKGPMRHAFITTNPLIPKEYFAPKGVDKFVLDLNKDIEFTLLNCPGKYSVKVATFTGKVVLDQKVIQQIEKEEEKGLFEFGNQDSRLAQAAEDAHRLCKSLRAQGVEAYEFHDRFESIVTVGSFEKVGTPREDGKIEINPQIFAIMRQYGGQPSNAAAKISNKTPTSGLQARTILVPREDKLAAKRISLDIQPLPVEVPKRSFASDYQQTGYFK